MRPTPMIPTVLPNIKVPRFCGSFHPPLRINASLCFSLLNSATSDQVNQFTSLVPVGSKIIDRFSQHQLTVRLTQQIFRESQPGWAGKTDFTILRGHT